MKSTLDTTAAVGAMPLRFEERRLLVEAHETVASEDVAMWRRVWKSEVSDQPRDQQGLPEGDWLNTRQTPSHAHDMAAACQRGLAQRGAATLRACMNPALSASLTCRSAARIVQPSTEAARCVGAVSERGRHTVTTSHSQLPGLL